MLASLESLRFGHGVPLKNVFEDKGRDTYQDLYERAVKVDRVKSKLKVMNPNPSHPERKWAEEKAQSESVNQNVKRSTPTSHRSHV